MRATLMAIVLLAALPSLAQESFFMADLSYSTFNMVEMKNLQDYMTPQIPVQLKEVTRFPAYPGFNIAVGVRTSPKAVVGIIFGTTATGGRADYEDYSGSITIDQTLICYSAGLFQQAKVNHSDRWPLFFNFSESVVWTNMQLEEDIKVGTSDVNQQASFKSMNFGLRPSVILRRSFTHTFVQLGIGYEVQITGRLHVPGSKAYLTNGDEDVHAEWGGLRATFGFGVFLNKKND